MLNVADLITAAEIIKATQRGDKIVRLLDSGDQQWGTLRNLSADTKGNYAHGDADPEQTLVRITWRNGFDTFPTLPELIEGITKTTYVIAV